MEGNYKFNTETLRVYHFKYLRNYRGISVMWGILSIIWCILNLVVFVQPQWIGDSPDSKGFGHLGVFSICTPDYVNNNAFYTCSGSPFQFDSILSGEFRATTFFVGVSALLMLITVAALLFFFCFKKTLVFYFCGIMQFVSALFMLLACVIFPAGWSHADVLGICGDDTNAYRLGKCSFRWAFVVAILGVFDAFFLGLLAIFLAVKRAKMEVYSASGTVTKSELNGFSAESMSKRSVPIQPVVTVPDDRERISEYSQVASRRPQNFQL